jgi:dipeptidase E
MSVRALLLSNSTCFGKGYLDHAIEEIADLFRGAKRIVFVPFALNDHAAYGAKAAERLRSLGLETATLLEDGGAPDLLARADGIFIGGGNTFRLLGKLYRCSLLDPIRARALQGIPYLGASAGTVVAGPTIRTTNDMPIVHPPSLDALGLVPFQINCHYLDADPASRHMGETRETRLREFHEENDTAVLALREGAWVSVEGATGRLRGSVGARLFVKGEPPVEHGPGADLGRLWNR